MFTDETVTPRRLEILLDTVREFRGGVERKTLLRLLQPVPLAPGDPEIASAVLLAATKDLQLVRESEGGKIVLADDARKLDTPAAILQAFDRRVLANTEAEPHLALYYAFVLGLGKAASGRHPSQKAWADEYNKAVHDERPPVPFNATALGGLDRWYDYAGLGWYDPSSNFQANPYPRLRRALPAIFGRERTLDADAFMDTLARVCPELDGGELFLQANRQYAGKSTRECTLGLSHALVELDLDGVLRLSRPADSQGWSVAPAMPVPEPVPDRAGDRMSSVTWLLPS